MKLIKLLMICVVCLTTFTSGHIHDQHCGYNFETKEGCTFKQPRIWDKEPRG